MKKLLVLLFIGACSTCLSQEINGGWVSEGMRTSTLKNHTVNRFYEIVINKKTNSLGGKTKTSFSWKQSYLGFNLFGSVDMLNHTLTLQTEGWHSSNSPIDSSDKNVKEGDRYKWTYTADSAKEYLTLLLDEENPHLMLDSMIIFSRPKMKRANEVAVQSTATEVPKMDSVIHPVTVRANKLFKEIITDTNLVKIDLYDVGEIDGDSVSLFLNGKLVAEHQMLQASAITFTITLDKNLLENKLILFAENLGRVPPNTAYMVITINKKEYTLNMQSDEKTNGEVVFRFAGK